MSNDGLFDKFNVQTLVFHFAEDFDRFLGFPTLIGIDSQLDIITHCLPDRFHPKNILGGIFADRFYLSRVSKPPV